jgi:hypothetical protein
MYGRRKIDLLQARLIGAVVLWELQQKADYSNWHDVADVAAERHHISNPVRVAS